MFWMTLGWVLWGFIALLSLGLLLSSNRDGGVRFMMRTQGLVLSLGMLATSAFPVSKFHLVWLFPVAFVTPMFVMQFRVASAMRRAQFAIDEQRPRDVGRQVGSTTSEETLLTPDRARGIVDAYASALARGIDDNSIARRESWLGHSRESIMQAMKLELALSMVLRSNEEIQDQLCSGAKYLPSFIPDEQARRLDGIYADSKELRKRKEPRSIEQMRGFQHVGEYETEWMQSGLQLQAELSDFLDAVRRIDANDVIYWQKILTLAGIRHSPELESAIWRWLGREFEARQ